METRLLRATDVATRLNISRSQAFALMRSGELPSVKFGRCTRCRPEDLEAFIASRLSGNSDPPLNAGLAAVTASPEADQVNPTKKKVPHGQ